MNKILFGFLLSVSFLFIQCKTQKSMKMTNTEKDKASFRGTAPSPAEAKPVNLGDYSEFKLDNGLTVIVVENSKLPTRSYQLFVDLPPYTEKDKAGTATLMGSLLSEGTARRNKAQLDEDIDFLGARFSTSENGIFASCLSKHSSALLEIMSEVIFEPAFPEESFGKLVNQQISGLAGIKSDPNSLAYRVGNVVNFGKENAYGEVMTEATLSNITLEDTKNFFTRYFKPNVSYLIIVGDITADQARTEANHFFGKWERGEVEMNPADRPRGMAPEGLQVAFVNRTGAPQSLAYVTYPVEYKISNPDFIKARIMNSIFGGYFGSRLNMKLREEKAYTYGARSSLSQDKYVGTFFGGANVGNAVTDSALVDILGVMQNMRENEVSDEELQTAKNVAIGNFAISLENPQTLANLALNISRYNLPKDFYNNFTSNIDKVTKQDILEMARKYLDPANAYILVVGNQDEVAPKLKVFATDGKINYYDVDGNRIEVDEEAAAIDFDPFTVIDKYLEAIGGIQKIKEINSYILGGQASIMGQDIAIETHSVYPEKYRTAMMMSGMVMQEQIINGSKGIVKAQGQKIDMEMEQVNSSRDDMYLISQIRYRSPEYKLSSMGMEMIDNRKLYKIKVETPYKVKTEYYDAETGLLVKDVAVQEQMGEKVTLTQTYGVYKDFSGIRYPSEITIEGLTPFPLVVQTRLLEINQDFDLKIFEF